MGVFDDNSMTWDEPSVVRKKYHPYPLFPIWSHFIFVAITLIMILIAIFVRAEDPPSEQFYLMIIGVLIGALGGYGIPLIDGLGGGTIRIGPSGVERIDSAISYSHPILMLLKNRNRRWKWEDIDTLYIQTEELNGKTIQVIEIVDHDQQPIGYIGLPTKKFKMEKFLNILTQNNCPIDGPEEIEQQM